MLSFSRITFFPCIFANIRPLSVLCDHLLYLRIYFVHYRPKYVKKMLLRGSVFFSSADARFWSISGLRDPARICVYLRENMLRNAPQAQNENDWERKRQEGWRTGSEDDQQMRLPNCRRRGSCTPLYIVYVVISTLLRLCSTAKRDIDTILSWSSFLLFRLLTLLWFHHFQ